MDKKIIFTATALCISLQLVALESKLNKDVLERMVQPKVSYESSYVSDADVSGSKGSVAVSKNRIQLNNAMFGISYTNWAFNWSDIDALPFGNGLDTPIDQMHSVRLNANIPYFINKDWFMLTSFSLNSTFERELDDSYGAGLFSFASYKIDEDHSIQMGAFANYHPISTLALPVMSYSYRAKQKDGFIFILGFPRAYAGYFINPKTLIRTGMIFSQSVIKLSKDSSIENAGYIEAKDYMGNLGVSHELSERFRIEGDLLYSLKREFIIYNNAGDEQSSYGIEPSLGLNLRLRYLF